MFLNLSPMVKRLLIINAAVYFLGSFLSMDVSRWFGLYYVFSPSFLPYQFFTYMFVHAGLWHLFGNMIGLLVFGNLLERFWGSKRFLFFYMLTGTGAGLLYGGIHFVDLQGIQTEVRAYVSHPEPEGFNAFLVEHAPRVHGVLLESGFIDAYADAPGDEGFISESIRYVRGIYDRRANIPMVGASGAIFGILMAFGLLFPNTELLLLFPPIPIKAKYLVLFYGAYELWSELSRMEGDNVAHLAHLGGMLIGFIIVKYWQKSSQRFY